MKEYFAVVTKDGKYKWETEKRDSIREVEYLFNSLKMLGWDTTGCEVEIMSTMPCKTEV